MNIKSRSLEIVTNSKAPNMVVVPPKLLDSDASQKYVRHVQVHPLPRHQSSHVLWEPSPTSKAKGGGFGTHIFLGPLGLVL